MANFLDNNSEKICLAFAILLSLPGIPVIYYGDEIGAQNNLEYGKKAAQKRKEVLKEINENLDSYDSRDINRGPILKDHFYNSMRDGETLGNVIYKTVKNLIRVRKETPALRRGKLSKIPSDKKEIFSYLIISNDQQLIVINNLTENKLKTSLTLPNNLVETLSKKIDMINLINGTKTNVCLRYGKLDIDIEPCQTLWLS
jgi:maltose alpha-D-glucosyltransferase/alpha-amylase